MLVHPDQVADFILIHQASLWVFFNVAFDFWVLIAHMNATGRHDVVAALWEMADRNRFRDAMLLDMLARLAVDGSTPTPRNLGVVACEVAGINDLNKKDPYRLRYAETIGKDWSTIESGFFTYAVKDPIATFLSYQRLCDKAQALSERHQAFFGPDAAQRYGLLSEAVQVKGAISLVQIGRTGMTVDKRRLEQLDQRLSDDLNRLTLEMEALPESQALFKRNKTGQLLRTKTGLPSMRESELQRILRAILRSNGERNIAPPLTSEGLLKTGEEIWAQYTSKSEFVRLWLALSHAGKQRQFTKLGDSDRVRPTYSVLVRTGRSSFRPPFTRSRESGNDCLRSNG